MDLDKLGNASTKAETGASGITRTKTMNEIISKSSGQIIHQVDPSVPCLRSSIQKQTDAVVSVLKRTRTINEIIESNAEIMRGVPNDSNHFLRSIDNKNQNDFPAKKPRTTDVDDENSSSQTQQLTRTKTMNDIISNNNLDIYQYLNETDPFLRSSRADHSGATPAISSELVNSETASPITRTRTMDEIMGQAKTEMTHTDLEGCSYSLRTRPNVILGINLPSEAKAEELRRLDEEYIDMQIRFNETRRKELRSVLGILSKSRLSHKRLMQEANDLMGEICALGEGSSHMAKKIALFRWLNRESVNRCQGLITEVMEMDRNLQPQLCQLDDLLSLPLSLAVVGNSSEPENLTSEDTNEK